MGQEPDTSPRAASPSWCFVTVAASAVLGLALMADQAVRMSTTYDEVTYLRIAAHWWRTGEQNQISRLGSPLTFWKVQQAPTLWALDRLGFGSWIDDPVAHQEQLLPVVRIGASWFWLLAMLIAANWARQLHGPRAMALASLAFALSPNLLAHGSLVTMEMPPARGYVLLGDALWLLALPEVGQEPRLLGERGVGRVGDVVEVHDGADPADPGVALGD